ncbi:MAG: YdjY domain-containing protein [Planctomycetaceae bacterium]
MPLFLTLCRRATILSSCVAVCAALGFVVPRAGICADQPDANAAQKASAKPELRPLNPEGTVLLDLPGKRLLLKTQVVLREGQLEMLCCPKQTKEHESILALDAKAYVVHTGLLALGAKPGTPVGNDPEFKPPTGQKIAIFLMWTDDKGKAQRAAAQSWVRNSVHRFWSSPLARLPDGVVLPRNTELRYDHKLKELSWYGPMTLKQKREFESLTKDEAFQKAIAYFYDQGQSSEMKAHWVFCGSGFYTDPNTGKEAYLAEDGDLICVANFPGATLDVAVESSAQEASLLFEAYTERIPPRGTPVTVELVPMFDDPKRD